jgi:hypothetical protein
MKLEAAIGVVSWLNPLHNQNPLQHFLSQVSNFKRK